MRDFNRKVQKMQRDRVSSKKKAKKNDRALPVYGINGRTVSSDQVRRKHRLGIALIIIAACAAFLYAPQFFMPAPGDDAGQAEAATVDKTAIRSNNNVLRDNPAEDFDGDGIQNTEETTLGTNPWLADSDGDHLTDYYEVYTADSDPCSANTSLLDAQTKQDENNGKNLGSPYKIGNVILWADDYTSKAYGSVVKTSTGYRFCMFDGYAQFPEEDGKYAYRFEDGVRTLLPYREKENVWKVSAGDLVELYQEPLDELVEVNFLSATFYLPANPATKILAKIVPDRGFLTATSKMRIDVDPDTADDVTAEIAKPLFQTDDVSRLAQNSNTLNDLLFVRQSISENNCCIAISLFNSEKGEYLCVAYGYTHYGDLLIADMETLQPVGTLTITEQAQKIIDNNGMIVNNTYFDFKGFGFDSTKGDRISFFAASSSSVELPMQNNMEEKGGTLSGTEETQDDTTGQDGAADNPDAGTDSPAATGTADGTAASGTDTATQDSTAGTAGIGADGSGMDAGIDAGSAQDATSTIPAAGDTTLTTQPADGTAAPSAP